MHEFSNDVFHVIFDNMLLKDSVQISRYLISFTLYAAQQTIASLEHSRFPILLLYFDHRLMKVFYFWRELLYVLRVFVWRPDQ